MAFSWLSFGIVSVSSRLTCQVVLPKVILELNVQDLNPLTSLPELVISTRASCRCRLLRANTNFIQLKYLLSIHFITVILENEILN